MLPQSLGRLGVIGGQQSLNAAIAALFASGEQGVWYDPSDINLNWRRNLLPSSSEQFDNVAWIKSNASISANAIVAPDGTLSGDTLADNSAGGTAGVGVTRDITLTTPVTHTFSFYAKANGLSWVSLQITAFTSAPIAGACYYDLANGVLGGTNQIAGTITAVGNGWYRCTGIVTPNVGDLSGNFAVYVADANGDITVDCDGTSSIYIWGAQLEVGSTASTYQRITNGVADYADSNTPVLYEDSAGTIPVASIERPVGLMLDKRKGIPTITELLTNNGFATDTVWSKGTGWSIAAGVATKVAGSASLLSQSVTVTAGVTYRLVYTISRTAGSITPQLTGGSTVNGTAARAGGTHVETLTAVSGNVTFALYADASFAGTVDNVYLKRVAGNDAYQAVSAARPTLRARYTLLTYSQEFNNPAWPKINASITQDAVVAPDGTTTADKLIPSVGVSDGRVTQTFTGQIGVAYTYSIYAKQGELSNCQVYSDDGATNVISVAYNLATGAVATALAVSGGNWTSASSSITSVGNGWWRIVMSWTAAVAAPTRVQTWCRDTGDGTSGIYIWGADLRPSNLATGLIPLYQRIAAATNYDTVGFPVYIQGNGSSQYMITSAIDFSGTDKVTAWTAVRKLSDAAQGIVCELTASYADNGASMFLSASGGAAANYTSGSRGAAVAAADQVSTATTYTAPISGVLSSSHDIAGDLTTLRVNSTAAANATGDKGAGNFANAALYLLCRGYTSLWFGGYFYGLVVRGAASNDGQIAQVERYMKLKSKAY